MSRPILSSPSIASDTRRELYTPIPTCLESLIESGIARDNQQKKKKQSIAMEDSQANGNVRIGIKNRLVKMIDFHLYDGARRSAVPARS